MPALTIFLTESNTSSPPSNLTVLAPLSFIIRIAEARAISELDW